MNLSGGSQLVHAGYRKGFDLSEKWIFVRHEGEVMTFGRGGDDDPLGSRSADSH